MRGLIVLMLIVITAGLADAQSSDDLHDMVSSRGAIARLDGYFWANLSLDMRTMLVMGILHALHHENIRLTGRDPDGIRTVDGKDMISVVVKTEMMYMDDANLHKRVFTLVMTAWDEILQGY